MIKSIKIKHELPLLPLLDKLVAHFGTEINLNDTALVAVQHILPTTVTLFYKLIETFKLGANNVYLLGKHYSSNESSKNNMINLGVNVFQESIDTGIGNFSHIFKQDIKQLWKAVQCSLSTKPEVNKVIILDDGGHCLANAPDAIKVRYKVIGIEQTTKCIRNQESMSQPFPVIKIATSNAKRELEVPIIAKSIIQRSLERVDQATFLNSVVGVIGYGAIGKAIVAQLQSLKIKFGIYDTAPSLENSEYQRYLYPSLDALLNNSQIIIGCTGEDIFATTLFNKPFDLFKNIFFISCTSEDIEFLSLIKHIVPSLPPMIDNLSDIVYRMPSGHTLKILRGGYPINFSREREVENPRDIQLVRALLLAGIIQAGKNFDNIVTPINQGLSSSMQEFIVKHWLVSQNNSAVCA